MGHSDDRASTGGDVRAGFPAEDYASFHGDLADVRKRLLESYEGLERPAPPTAAEVTQRLREKMPLVPLDLVCPDESLLIGFAREILEIASEHGVLEVDECEETSQVLTDLKLSDLIATVARGDTGKLVEVAGDRDIAADALLFITEHLARAILGWHATSLVGLVDDEMVTQNGNCPVCGNLPRFSSLEGDEGTRYLVCGMCESTWRFKRLGCPFCDNEEQKSLRYFTVSNEPGYRVGVCDKCKRYLKQVDLRVLRGEKVSLADMDVSSARLDLLAWREGFR